MADLFKSFKAALSQAGPGLVAQMQGKDQMAAQLYKQGANQAAQQKLAKDKQYSNEMKMQDMALKLQKAKDSRILKQKKESRDEQMFQIKLKHAQEGTSPDAVKIQQIRDTYNAATNNPTGFDPTKKGNSIIDLITGETVDRVYTGVQNRANQRNTRGLNKDLAKEMERNIPVKTVLNSLDILDELLEKGTQTVSDSEGLFGMKIGFTGSIRNGLQTMQRKTGVVEMTEVDNLFEQFNSYATQVLANQVKSFTGAQATDAEREFLAKMGPQPQYSPSKNRQAIKDLRNMMQFVNDRNESIQARLQGTPIKNIGNHIGKGQTVMEYHYANPSILEKDDTKMSPTQQLKSQEYLRLEQEKLNLYKQLQSMEDNDAN